MKPVDRLTACIHGTQALGPPSRQPVQMIVHVYAMKHTTLLLLSTQMNAYLHQRYAINTAHEDCMPITLNCSWNWEFTLSKSLHKRKFLDCRQATEVQPAVVCVKTMV